MPRSPAIQFVSAGLSQPKKRDHVLARRQLYLNYGALTLASQLNLNGHGVHLRHGEHEDPDTFAERLFADGRLPSAWPLMVSMPSFYALSWTQAFCRAVKRRDPKANIVIGGRWVTGPDPAWLHGLIPDADVVVPGFGEPRIWGILGLPSPQGTGDGEAPPAFGLHHRLVDGFERFQPSIETSRGCGMGCAFCEERGIPLSRLRDPLRLAELLAETVAEYGNGEIHPYFQSSFFLPNPRWATELQRTIRDRDLAVPWRCETRVDGLKPETVAALAASGLKVIDLGLETASPTQVRAMRKARDPERYLRAASQLLEACAANGVWVKVNVLLYAGETAETLAESQAWLDQHAHAIKGVSVGPVVAFGPPGLAGPFLRDLAAHGARPVDEGSAASTGVTQLHLSPRIDQAEAERLSLELSRRYMDADAYFDLKSFSYYPRGYTRGDFDRDVADCDAERLPFRVAPYSGATPCQPA
ncbi:B12-binding domain-containing radical SAM protein [Methylorubrum extorquens]